MISKSQFIRGLQCLKSLYLHRNRPYLRDPIPRETLAKFRRGHEVGKLAHELFPGGINLTPAGPKSSTRKISQVKANIEAQIPVMYEVPFIGDDLLAIMDIITFDNDCWNAYEVKSSLSVADVYLWDIAFQAYVINAFGLKETNFSIVHIRSDYVMNDKLNIHNFFHIVPVNQEVYKKQHKINDLLIKIREILSADKSPEIPVGMHCHYPYTCDFFGHCHKFLKKPNIFSIPEIPVEEKYKYVSEGNGSLTSVVNLISDTVQQNRIQSILNNTIVLQKKEIRSFLKFNSEKLIFLKIFSFNPAVPIFKDSVPFETTPVLFSTGEHHEDQLISKTIFPEADNELYWENIHSVFNKIISDYSEYSIVCYGDEEILGRIRNTLQRIFKKSLPAIKVCDLYRIFEQGLYCAPDIAADFDFISVAKHFINNETIEKLSLSPETIGETNVFPEKFIFSENLKKTITDSGIEWCKYLSEIHSKILEKIYD